MSKLRQILRLHAQGERKLKISELTGVSRNTLKKYLKIYQRLGLTPLDIDGVSDKELDELFGENLLPEPGEKYKTLEAISCCEHALAYYGGVPKAIVPDNLKSAVTKSSLYEPTLNQSFENFALH